MWKMKLGMSLGRAFSLSIADMMEPIARANFDAVSPEWCQGAPVDVWADRAKGQGLVIQSLHAPYHGAAAMWDASEEKASAAVQELLDCLHDCADHQIPVMVAHAFIGFEDHNPTPDGLRRYQIVVEEAKRLGVKIALENTEGEEYLAALFDHFCEDDTVGFCWDSGHEMCYNHSQDMLARYGDRLLMTHINDNLGIRDYGGKITPLDDLHLLPFDGIADWDDNAARLRKAKCPEILNFELGIRAKPGRHEHRSYAKMEQDEFLAECYKRACRVAAKITLK